MRPVRAPQNSTWVCFDESLGKWDRIQKWPFAAGNPLGTAHLDPSQGIVSVKREQRLKRYLLQPVGRLHATHVIDDERHVDATQQLALAHDVFGIEVQHHVPAQRLDAREQPIKNTQVGNTPQVFYEVESNSANAPGL